LAVLMGTRCVHRRPVARLLRRPFVEFPIGDGLTRRRANDGGLVRRGLDKISWKHDDSSVGDDNAA
ncbi:hypothetical protein ABZ589_39395, partial [Streptomyces sp. NPDC013313]|uniref:hypothetical protein n=1 Tax=Streptomyces sp. NPDC013313 TaxID=3155603 RepID=UPI0033D26FF4